MPITYPGQNASQAQIAQWMAARARAAGLPGELPVMAGLVESGLRNLPGGDRDSQGFFQMRSGIWNTGAYRGYANNPDLQMQWFIDQAKRANRGGNLGEWVANIERPAEQYRGRYQQRLSEAQGLLAGTAQAGSAMGAGGGAAAPASSAAAPMPLPQAAKPTLAVPQLGTGGATMLQRMLDQNAELAGVPGLVMPRQAASLEMPQWTAASLPTAAAQPGAPGGAPGSSYAPPGDAAQFIKAGRPSQVGEVKGLPGQGTHSYTEGPSNWQSDNAIDVYMPVGTPLYAVANGVIGSRFGSLGSSGRFQGNRLTLQSPGNAYYYAHLSRYAPGIKPGTKVRAGQLLGYSGEANGVAHLHLGAEHGNPASLYQ